MRTYDDGHEHEFDRLRQAEILDKSGIPAFTIEVGQDGRKRKKFFTPHIIGFEKYCTLCGLVEEALPVGSIVTRTTNELAQTGSDGQPA